MPDVDPRVAHLRDGLDVVEVAVRREHPAHAGRAETSSSSSCSLAASMITASPVPLQRSTNTLFSNGPTTIFSMRTSEVS